MRHPLVELLLAIAAALAAASAHATATVTITVNGATRSLTDTGFLFEQVGGSAVRLAPGESADYSFDYSISVHDDGLPAAFDFAATGCASLHLAICGPSYGGFEYAKADLITFYEDPRIIPSYVQQSGDNTVVELQTHSDSFAESLTQSGTIHVHITNNESFFSYSELYATYVALWVLAPIPEPAVLAQLLAGLGLVVVALRRRRTLRR